MSSSEALLCWSSSRTQPRSTARRNTASRGSRPSAHSSEKRAGGVPSGAPAPGDAVDAAPSVATAITPSRARRRSTASGAPCLSATVTTVRPSHCWRRVSGVPWAMMRPRSMIITRWQRSSTSGRMWVESSSVRSRPRSRMRSRMAMICLGSRPTVGSSRISTSGSWRIAVARPTRWRKPFDSVAMIWSRTSPSRQRSIERSIASPARLPRTPSSRARYERYSRTRISG